MNTEQYCLRWNDHRTILLTNFERLLLSSTSVDCTLAAEGQCLRAHKVVLSACSPFFELMLNQEKEKHPIIFMKDVKFKELQAILEYMYRGEVVIPHDQLANLLNAAESLQIKGLGCGEKSQTISGSRTSNQQQSHKQPQKQPLHSPLKQPPQSSLKLQLQPTQLQQPLQQQPLQQIVQKQGQPFRQSATISRASDISQGNQVDSAPQVVDLTDDRAAMSTSFASHLAQENAKRSIPQNTTRVKRVAYPVGTQERFNIDSNITLSHYPVSQNNLIPSAGQAGGTNIIVTTASVPSVITTPARQTSVISRPINESGGQNIPQAVTPPTQRPETHDKKESGNQPLVYKPKSRPITIQKRYIQGNVTQNNSKQNSSPVMLQSQNPAPVDAPKVSITPTKENTASITNESIAPKVEPIANPSPIPDIEETKSTADQIQSLDSELRDSELESAEQTKEVDAENATGEDPKESPVKLKNKPGPSGVGKNAGKPGRRGRAPASERKYPCTECNKRFTHKNYLENHLRIHDGECYECDYCTKSFLSRAALVKHLRSHATKSTTNTTHKCQLCGASFPNAADLEKHLTDHTMSGNTEEKMDV